MTDRLTDDDLRHVARHGGSAFTRALALSVLARRRDATDDLLEVADDPDGTGDTNRGATS
jgi:hypothetical protein